ncbi:MAG: transporter substrate-binding domain-containing protein [Chloroflexota bacterium]|jgi:polar amino acid transport system substrate-binding protein|nr:transporter substrate-binding domain-containing protein [Chloroflexota bacterium]
MDKMRRLAVLPVAMLVLAACQSGNGGAGGSPAESGAAGEGETVCAGGDLDGLLAEICEAGTIVVSTDPAYPPQSFLNEETGEYEGFDIDVALEIGERLGVDVEFTDPTFDAVVAGNWSGRWDMSVGSVTVTAEREEVLDFTQPYYFTPAQLAAQAESEIESVEDLAGETVCVGESTTYLFWIEGTLTLPESAGEIADVPEGMEATTFPTDIDCAEAWRSGRTEDFAGWLTALPTAQGAIDEGYPVKLVGEPVFYEPLAVAFDKAAENNDSLVEAVDAILGEMHEDGTLTALSEEWYEGTDLTTQE